MKYVIIKYIKIQFLTNERVQIFISVTIAGYYFVLTKQFLLVDPGRFSFVRRKTSRIEAVEVFLRGKCLAK